jgi:hypothetical protein
MTQRLIISTRHFSHELHAPPLLTLLPIALSHLKEALITLDTWDIPVLIRVLGVDTVTTQVTEVRSTRLAANVVARLRILHAPPALGTSDRVLIDVLLRGLFFSV